MVAGLYFSAAFTLQRMIISELAYLALAPILLRPLVNGVVYLVVGLVMAAAGAAVLRRSPYPHVHLFGHHHDAGGAMEATGRVFSRHHEAGLLPPQEFPLRWTLVHGFIAGFGFGPFSIFVNTAAAPVMRSAWLGSLPGLFFGLGTMATLTAVSFLFGASLRWTRRLGEPEIRRIGSQTGGRTLFFGGLLFIVAGVASLAGWERRLPLDSGFVLMALFLAVVVLPALVYSVREVLGAPRVPTGP